MVKKKEISPSLTCRFYANELPNLDDVVVAKVHKITESGAYAHLLEYDNHDAMIPLSELSRIRIRSVGKHIKLGRCEYTAVIRVDEEQGYVDLSKSKVYQKDLLACEDRFGKGKLINSILRNVAAQLGYKEKAQLESLYERTAWRFDQKAGRRSGCFNVFKKALDDPSVFDDCDLVEEEKKKLVEEVVKRMSPQPIKIRSDIEVSCFGYDGVDAVKKALKEGLGSHSTTEELSPIQVNLIAHPLFSITTTNMSREEGIKSVEAALNFIQKSIESFSGGNFNVVAAPEVVYDPEEREMKKRAQMLDLEEEEESVGCEGESDFPKRSDMEFSY